MMWGMRRKGKVADFGKRFGGGGMRVGRGGHSDGAAWGGVHQALEQNQRPLVRLSQRVASSKLIFWAKTAMFLKI